MTLNVLSFTTLYPNEKQPRHGIFIEQRLRHLMQSTDINLKVVAPVPWFPFKINCFGQYALYSQVSKAENRYSIEVQHPNYLVVPKIGMSLTPLSLALSGYKQIKSLMAQGFEPDIIDAHYFYPDGVAAALIGKWLKKPVIITARGSDINVLPKYALPRKMIQWAAKKAAMNITVSTALKEEMKKLGVPGSKITVLRNGVDLETFRVLPTIRNKESVSRRNIISVGNLIELKGHHLVIEALKELPNMQLIIVGEGAMASKLKQLAIDLDVAKRVCFVGYKTHQELVSLYNKSDVLVLASSREGLPNVILEAMACGTPVIATCVGGAPEVLTDKAAGMLLEERSAKAIVQAVRQLLENPPLMTQTRQYAEAFSWDQTVKKLNRVIKQGISYPF